MDIKIHDLYNKLTYIMELEHRVTIIQGDSATGKSTLVRYIEMKDSIKVNIESSKNLLATNINNLLNTIEITGDYKLNSDYIYVLDEYDGVDNPEMAKILNNSSAMFIIITRDSGLPNINYGIDQIYKFKNSGKYNYLVKMYNNLNDRELNLEELSDIVTEYSGSGLDFYKVFNNFNVYSSYGNSNITKNLKNNQIIVIDSLGYGPYIKTTIDTISSRNIFIIYPKSFEYLLLISLFPNTVKYNAEIFNYEKYYYKIAINVFNEYGLNYSKSKLSGWVLEEAQVTKINDTINSLFNINLNKLNKIRLSSNSSLKWGWY